MLAMNAQLPGTGRIFEDFKRTRYWYLVKNTTSTQHVHYVELDKRMKGTVSDTLSART